MALTENRIGIHTFISLQGYVHPPAQVKTVVDRPGVNGSEFVLLGRKGPPSTLISQVDAESYEHAKSYILDYLENIAGDAVEVVQAGTSYDTFGYRCAVIGVEEVSCFQITGASGNSLAQPSAGFVIARWTLVAVPYEE